MTNQELQAANERLLQKRESLGITRTESLIPLTLSLPQITQKIHQDIEERQKGNPDSICPKCGALMDEFYSPGKSGLVWLCESASCEKERLEKQRLQELQRRKDHPEGWLKQYGVPTKYLSRSLDGFEGNSKIVQLCREYAKDNSSTSLFFCGPPGTGKTHLSIATLREMVRNDVVRSAVFVTVPELLLRLRKSFQSDSDVDESDVIDRYSNAPFLVADDLGAERSSEWSVSALYIIINRRNQEERPTIFTTNLSLEEIEEQLSPRIASRLADCRIIKINMPDYRKRRTLKPAEDAHRKRV